MNAHTRLVTVLAAITTVSAAHAQDQYLCISDLASGFAFKSNKWDTATFNVEDERFVLRRVRDSDDLPQTAWMITKIGNDYPEAICDNDFTDAGWLFCEGLASTWRVNRESLRFMYWYWLGYTRGEEDTKSTPNITIGKCGEL
jgi:hypothetical protein